MSEYKCIGCYPAKEVTISLHERTVDDSYYIKISTPNYDQYEYVVGKENAEKYYNKQIKKSEQLKK